MLTIAQFADRTGISPSALRFYERKGLLVPAQRLENGYRVYAPEQVAEAARYMEGLGITTLSGGYTRTLDLVDGKLIGEVGVRVQLRRGQRTMKRRRTGCSVSLPANPTGISC